MNGKTFEGGVAATSLSSRPARSTASRRSAIHLWYKSMSTSVPTSSKRTYSHFSSARYDRERRRQLAIR